MNAEELKKTLEKHQLWLNGQGGERANLSGADLSEANLIGANLSDAYLIGANLRGAVQQEVLDLWREGKDTLEISRIVRVHLKQVEAIIENGVVTLRAVRGRKRCGCGALLVAEPF